MEEVYVYPPKGFSGKDKSEKMLLLLKSLYVLKQAPKNLFDKIRTGLVERGFKLLEHDTYLFVKEEMICVVYVDDTLIAGPNSQAIEEEIRLIGITNDEFQHKFQLRDEGEVEDFLGIRI